MNFVAGLFLIILTSTSSANADVTALESDSYWCFDALCSRVLARYYSEDMVELQVDQLVMQQLLEEKFPTVATQMDNLGVSLACVSSSWLLCGFANALPWTTLLRTWDVRTTHPQLSLSRALSLSLCLDTHTHTHHPHEHHPLSYSVYDVTYTER